MSSGRHWFDLVVGQLPCIPRFWHAPSLSLLYIFVMNLTYAIPNLSSTNNAASLGNLTPLSHESSVQSHQESSTSKNQIRTKILPLQQCGCPPHPLPIRLHPPPFSNNVCGAQPRNCIKTPRGTVWNLRARVEIGEMQRMTRGWCWVRTGNGYIPCICYLQRLKRIASGEEGCKPRAQLNEGQGPVGMDLLCSRRIGKMESSVWSMINFWVCT